MNKNNITSEKMYRLFKNLVLGCVFVSSLTMVGCKDDDEDNTSFVIVNGDRKDFLDVAGFREVEYTVHLIRAENKDIWSDTLNLKIFGKGLANIESVKTVGDYDDYNYLYMQREKQKDGSYNFFHKSGTLGLNLFKNPNNNKEEANLIGYSDFFVRFRDTDNSEHTGHIKIAFMGDCPPTPVLTVKDVAGKPMQKVFNLADSFDEDGTVAKYEYCIDGKIVKYRGGAERFEAFSGSWQSGKAASGDNYITATTQSEITHTFEEPGEHVVYYRCMDNMGAWSLWYEQTIVVE